MKSTRMLKTRVFVLSSSICLLLFTAWCAGESAHQSTPSQASQKAIEAWQDLRFGMFIHWGPVALTGHEIGWSRGRETPIEEYDSLYKRFNPVKFNAEEWVAVAKAAGMKYMVLTTKHHDGFCLWDTRQTNYNIMNTPFGRDVVKELAAACKKGGIRFGTYYSTCDWHHPDFPLTSPGGKTVRATSDLDAYTNYLQAQSRELLTNYGPLLTLWYDVPQKFDSSRGQGVINMVRAIQPDIVINNRTGARGDYDTPEQRIGGFQIDRPWETCMTICRQWAWKPNDSMKSLEQCLHTLIRTNGGDGNLLFNVGPMPSGEMEARQVDRLKEMGRWLAKNGEAIYATRGGPWTPCADIVSTRKHNKIYLHLLTKNEGPITLSALPVAIQSAQLLNGPAIRAETKEGLLTLDFTDNAWDAIDTIVEITITGSALDIAPIHPFAHKFAPIIKATASHTISRQYAASHAIDGNSGTRWATPAGTRACWIQLDLDKETTLSSIMINEAYAHPKSRVLKFELQKRDGDSWTTFHHGTGLGEYFKTDFVPVTTQAIRLNVLDAGEGPTITEIQIPLHTPTP
ncbi:alpha-L-fucosidase [Planctomycetota bacterium]